MLLQLIAILLLAEKKDEGVYYVPSHVCWLLSITLYMDLSEEPVCLCHRTAAKEDSLCLSSVVRDRVCFYFRDVRLRSYNKCCLYNTMFVFSKGDLQFNARINVCGFVNIKMSHIFSMKALRCYIFSM